MRVVSLVGVVEDGTPRAARSLAAPVNPRRTITYQQGSTLQIRLKVLLASGAPVDLTKDGAALTITVRKLPLPAGMGRPTGLWTAAAPSPKEVGVGVFTVVPTDLPPIRVMWGRYTWEATLTRTAGGVDKVVPISPFVIEPGDT